MLSPEYVEGFTPERGLAELVANALDADPKATFRYNNENGTAVIADRGPGLGSRALVIGESTSRHRDDAVGRFGESPIGGGFVEFDRPCSTDVRRVRSQWLTTR